MKHLLTTIPLHLPVIALLVLAGCHTPDTQASSEGSRIPTAANKGAQAFRANGEPVTLAPDGNYYCEAEEFQVQKPGWQAKSWGENYYAATLANTYLSRKAFLGAPAQCAETVATINVDVAKADKYLVLVRYEAAYRFERQFRITVEQDGETRLDRLYGARDNVKIWAFGQKLKKEVEWSWGAVENVVWEGHDAFAELKAGKATISLIAGKQEGLAAKRNVDIVLLTNNFADVNNRIATESYLPLDGLLTQTGDVWLKITNIGAEKLTLKSLTYPGGPWQQHSPYWIHLRDPEVWKPLSVEVAAGQTTEWIDVGGTMDTMNDGQWGFTGDGKYKLELGLRKADGNTEGFAEFHGEGDLPLVANADVRYVQQVRTMDQALYDLLDVLRKVPVHGKAPTDTFIYAQMIADEDSIAYGLKRGVDEKYDAAVAEFRAMFNIRPLRLDNAGAGAYLTIPPGVPADKLAAHCDQLGDAKKDIAVVSLGDEIGLPRPGGGAPNEGFRAFLKAKGLAPQDIDPAAGDDWQKIVYNPDANLQKSNPGVYYWSQRYLHHYGIDAIKERTDIVQEYLPNAHIGANFSPHHGGARHSYLGEVFKWVNCFRRDGMTMPWSEDYIWQVPMGTQQMNGINLDLFRAGLRGKPDRKIMYYVMPHWPGNRPDSWRRLFYNALGHGMKKINLFEFRPVWNAYSENHVTNDDTYVTVLQTVRELGLYEDIVQSGQVRQADTALWFSETGDIWDDNKGSFAAAKRGLYVAILHGGAHLDFVVEADAQDGTLAQYKVLFLTDNHVSLAASKNISAWVKNGGALFATAGAGMFDEYNRPNQIMRKLYGVDQTALEMPEGGQVDFIKQDLPYVEPVATLRWNGADLSAYGVRSKVTAAGAEIDGKFSDGSAAIATRVVGKGSVMYCAFLPSLAYFAPAIPQRPLDRSSSDDAMSHFIPTAFDAAAAQLINRQVDASRHPVVASERLVETTIIESKKGVLITLANWSAAPVKNLTVTVKIPIPKTAVLASGAKLTSKTNGDGTEFTLDLDVADALILRD